LPWETKAVTHERLKPVFQRNEGIPESPGFPTRGESCCAQQPAFVDHPEVTPVPVSSTGSQPPAGNLHSLNNETFGQLDSSPVEATNTLTSFPVINSQPETASNPVAMETQLPAPDSPGSPTIDELTVQSQRPIRAAAMPRRALNFNAVRKVTFATPTDKKQHRKSNFKSNDSDLTKLLLQLVGDITKLMPGLIMA
jgi:hypothetical protein